VPGKKEENQRENRTQLKVILKRVPERFIQHLKQRQGKKMEHDCKTL
jgi:hypothetical protein